MQKPESLFDNRVVERNIAAGLVTREEYEAWLASLEDCSEKLVETATQFHRTQPSRSTYDED